MNYLNLSITDLTSATFLGEDPTNRATWLCLMRYCAQQETGGIIEQAGEWGERRWQQLCGITKAEVQTPSKLWSFSDGNLRVKFYPAPQESAAKNRRNAIKAHNKQRDIQRGIECPIESTDKDKDKDKDKDNDKETGKKTPPPYPIGQKQWREAIGKIEDAKHREGMAEWFLMRMANGQVFTKATADLHVAELFRIPAMERDAAIKASLLGGWKKIFAERPKDKNDGAWNPANEKEF